MEPRGVLDEQLGEAPEEKDGGYVCEDEVHSPPRRVKDEDDQVRRGRPELLHREAQDQHRHSVATEGQRQQRFLP